jgi:ketosteroid isomerase-like protein
VSDDNLQIVRAFTEAFNAGDIDACISYCHRDVEFHSILGTVGGIVYRGHDDLRTWHRDVQDAWGGQIRSELEMLFDLGEYALVFLEIHARGRQSGAEVSRPAAVVTRFRESRLVYYRAYVERKDALNYLGVSEDALEPIEP